MIWLYLIVGAILLGVSEVLRYYVEPNASSNKHKKRINTAWHIYRDLAFVCYIVYGYLLSQNSLWILLPSWTIHWILTDGIQNIIKGKDFFYTSPTSGNYVEMLGKWYIKLTLLLIGLTVNKYLSRNESRII